MDLVSILLAALAGGGYFGVTEGDYAFQNAEINLLWQAIGLAVCIAAGLLTGWVMCAILERTTGLGVTEEVQVRGYDDSYWELIHDLEPATTGQANEPALARAGDGDAEAVDVRTTPAGP